MPDHTKEAPFGTGPIMPWIVFEGPGMDGEKKRELVRSFAEAASRVTGIRKEVITTVIHENDQGNVGVGGELLVDGLARERCAQRPTVRPRPGPPGLATKWTR